MSHEVDSLENGICVEMDRSDEDGMESMGIPCAVCPKKLKEEKRKFFFVLENNGGTTPAQMHVRDWVR